MRINYNIEAKRYMVMRNMQQTELLKFDFIIYF